MITRIGNVIVFFIFQKLIRLTHRSFSSNSTECTDMCMSWENGEKKRSQNTTGYNQLSYSLTFFVGAVTKQKIYNCQHKCTSFFSCCAKNGFLESVPRRCYNTVAATFANSAKKKHTQTFDMGERKRLTHCRISIFLLLFL